MLNHFPQTKFSKKIFMTALLAGTVALSAGAATAATPASEQPRAETVMEMVALPTPEGRPATLTGTVSQLSDKEFVLTQDNRKSATINLDEWGQIQAPDIVRNGQRITISGIMVDDKAARPKIVAETIRDLESNRSYEYSRADSVVIQHEEHVTSRLMRDDTIHGDLVTGEVVSFNGLHFVIRTPEGLRSVNTAGLPYNPASRHFSPRLERGDTVTLRAEKLDRGVFSLLANDVVSITKSYSTTPIVPEFSMEKNGTKHTTSARIVPERTAAERAMSGRTAASSRTSGAWDARLND